MAWLAAEGLARDLAVGALQPPVVAVADPLLVRELPLRLARLEPRVLQEPQPAPRAQQQVALPLPLQEAPPAQVPALLALLLAEPVALPRPPAPGESLRASAEVLPLPFALPLPEQVALPGKVALQKVVLRHHAGAALLWLRSHRLPRGIQQVAGEIQDQVAQQDPVSFK